MSRFRPPLIHADRSQTPSRTARHRAPVPAALRDEGGDANGPRQPTAPHDAPLTRREIQVLRLVCEGRSNQEVADQLFLSKRTVDFHLKNVYTKLGVNKRVQALHVATRRGLISLGNLGTQV